MTTASSPLTRGAIFNGRYEIVRCIKSGGMGAVYEVRHLDTRRRRALKIMLPGSVFDPDLRARFKLEAIVTADVESDHIVETFDAGVDPETDSPFLVMELLKGEDLAQRVKRSGACSPQELIELLEQMAMALDKTHAAGIIHRDLKPENLFITRRDDGSPCLKILDFGIAKVVAREEQAKTTRAMGTPLYMSPEQLDGDGRIGPAADLYAVGHLAYSLLVGAHYFAEESRLEGGIYALLVRIMGGATEAPSVRAARLGVTLPPAFDAWFHRATAREPSARFAAASEQVSALAEVLGAPCRWLSGARAAVAQNSAPDWSGSKRDASSGPLGTQRLDADAASAVEARSQVSEDALEAANKTGTMASVWKAPPASSRIPRFVPVVALVAMLVAVVAYVQSQPGELSPEMVAGPAGVESEGEIASPAAAGLPSAVAPLAPIVSTTPDVPSAAALESAAAPSAVFPAPPLVSPPPGIPKVPPSSPSPPPASPEAVDPTRIRK